MNGNFYHCGTSDHLPADAYDRTLCNMPDTPRDPHSISDTNPDEESENQRLGIESDNPIETNLRYADLIEKHQELDDLSKLTRRMALSEDRYQMRLKIMEREQRLSLQRCDEMRFLLARAHAENEQLQNFIHRLSEEKNFLITDFKRLEWQNGAIFREFQRQRLHLQDLYFTLSLHGFDYVVLPNGKRIETHRPASEQLFRRNMDNEARWINFHYKSTPAFVHGEIPPATPAPVASQSVAHPTKTGNAQTCDELMRKLADLQKQRDHIDGYIEWLKAEARNKEHIYDDPFIGDVHPSDDDFEKVDPKLQKSGYDSQRLIGRTVNSNPSKDHNFGTSDTITEIPKKYHPLPENFLHQRSSPNQSLRKGDPQHTSHMEQPQSPGDRRGSLAAARAKFLRKDSIFAILLDSGSSVLSKPRRSIFSKQKSQHNAFVAGRGYSMNAGEFGGNSPKPARKIRTHII